MGLCDADNWMKRILEKGDVFAISQCDAWHIYMQKLSKVCMVFYFHFFFRLEFASDFPIPTLDSVR